MALTVGMAFVGDPTLPATWSGTPYGLGQGLGELGVAIAGLDAEFGRAGRAVARRVPPVLEEPVTRARTLKVRRAVRSAGPLDGLIQMGYEYELPPVAPLVTFDDMTIDQGIALRDGWFLRPQATTRAWRERQRRAFQRCSACCVASRYVADSLVRDYGVPPAKVRVVGLGRNLDPKPVPRDWSPPRFLFVGRQWERKRGPDVVKAFRRLREQVPEAELHVAGGHPPIGVEGVVEHGFLRLDVPAQRARVQALFERATCFVMPSRHEAFGLAYLEAAAAGIPSIGTTVGGARDAVGDAGRLVAPGDQEGLLAAMRELADPDTAAALGARGPLHAERYTWNLVAERVARALALPVGRSLADDLY